MFLCFTCRLVESGGGSVVTLKLHYDTQGLTPNLTHVFTEKNLEASVAGFRKAGLPCLSPDFIPETILRVSVAFSTYCN